MNIYLMKKPKRINSVSVTLFILLLVGGYAGWALIPIYWPMFQMTGIMSGVCNSAYHEQNLDKLLEQMVKEGKRTKLRISKENFSIEREPYPEEELLNLPERAQDTMRQRGKFCVATFHYEADFDLPLIERKQRFVFDKTVRSPLETVSWAKKDNCTCVSVPTGG